MVKYLLLVALMFSAAGLALAGQSQEVPVVAPGPDGPLGGTLNGVLSPDVPLAIIIPGSGPTDRDGNVPMAGMLAAPLRQLAQSLAEAGIASARIDKRGMFTSMKATADPEDVTIEDYATDVRSWISTLGRDRGKGCLWLAGHSEGGLVALAATRSTSVCGVILLATPGRRAGDVIMEQLQANPAMAPYLERARRTIADLEAGVRHDMSDMPVSLQPLFRPSVERYLRSLFSFDPVAAVTEFDGPILVVQGGRDLQVGASDARLLSQAGKDARLLMIDDMNHMLKSVSEDPQDNLAAYRERQRPLADGLAKHISGFILER